MTGFLETSSRRRIAYHRTAGRGPGVVFLGGFMSDMEGSKATHFEAWAKAKGRAFVRFDYSGHGQSSGAFQDGCIGDWLCDAMAVIEALSEGPQILVGSSMGGWISALIAREMSEKVAGMVTIAAAPDFTEDGFYAGFSEAEKAQLDSEGVVYVPSGYGDPYPITKRLIEDGRRHFLMRAPLVLTVPLRMLQGTEDASVSRETALGVLDHIEASDVRLTFVKGGDHSLSTPDNLSMIVDAIEDVLRKVS